MSDQSPSGNAFRAAVMRGDRPSLLVDRKNPRLGRSKESIASSIVQRSEVRRGDHRDLSRHRLNEEKATVRYRRKNHKVDIVNLSSGGAMIRADFSPQLWDILELRLGKKDKIECAVRWRRDDLIGLEFAHETRIECNPEERARLLLEVIQRSFPDVAIELESPDGPVEMMPPPEEEEDLGKRAEARHPMVWRGQIHFSFDSNPVRLRNISTGGALVDVAIDYPVGSEIMLDLGDAGQFDAVVSWTEGDQAGLSFKKPFDVACLAKLKPDLTPYQWERPDFLNSSDESSSPWDDPWGRRSLAALRSELEGFLKR
jgi:PilZ domain-containing protein